MRDGDIKDLKFYTVAGQGYPPGPQNHLIQGLSEPLYICP
jgi:hypothetical protein